MLLAHFNEHRWCDEGTIKLLTILTYYAPHWTGLTAHAVQVAEGLAARGIDVTVLTVRHSPELKRDEVVNGVRVFRLRPVARFSRGLITPTLLWAAPLLINKHDVVQIHTPLPEGPMIASWCRLLRRPLLMTHHGDLVMPPGFFNQVLQNVGYYVLLATGTMANAVTSYSRDYAQHSPLLRHFASKLMCIYPPVELPVPDVHAARAWRRELGLEGELLIGFAGRWVEEKGFDYLLQALPLVRKNFPRAHIIFAGDDHVVYDNFHKQCLPYIEPVRGQFTNLGLIRDPQKMANFYALCDLFVQPSRTDMLGLTQVEAMLSGTPVVASDIPGARVAVKETGFGKLSTAGQPGALADAICQVIQNREQYRPTRESVRQIFNTEKSLNQYQTLLESLVASPRRALMTAKEANPSEKPQAGQPSAQAKIVRYRGSNSQWKTLTPQDHAVLDLVLRNEADMAYRRRARILLDYLELKDGDSIFDCGCGMGFFLMVLGKLKKLRLIGLDGDLERLRWARRERVPASLLAGNIFDLPIANKSFEKVLCSEVLEHLGDDRRGLCEIFRVLKPGGILALSVPHARYPFWWDPLNAVWTRLGGQPIRKGPIAGIWSNHKRLYEPSDLVQKILDAGFELEAVEEQTHYSFPFIHFLVYGIGKPLLEKNLLPSALRLSADRFSGERNPGGAFNPINFGVKVLRYFDQWNEKPIVEAQSTFVNVLVKARKPLTWPK
jgi:glycosyltransferase involved in cell wall biosynthesis/ubiquinone/menaquinone biosynthesis C-methylase UbiE